MKKTMMKLLSVVMALMMLFGCFSTLVSAAAPHEHDKTTKLETIGPRCNAYGYTLYICSCGETWATDIVAKTEGVHSLEVDGTYEEVKAKDPSCLSAGNTAGKKCSWCGTTIEGNDKVGEPLGHDNQWVLEDGDCNNVESIVYKCVRKNCELKGAINDPQRQPIELVDCGAAGHNFVYKITKYPTCTAVASKAGVDYRVTVDGKKLMGFTIEHQDGTAEYECLDCGVTYKGIVIPWYNHDASNLVHKTNGSEDLCDEIEYVTEIVDGKPVVKEVVTEVFKAEWDECLVCGYATNYTYTNNVPKHNYVRASLAEAQELGYRTNYQEAFCYLSGYEVKTCVNLVNGKVCGDVHVIVTTVEHEKSFTCPTCADCQDCTHKDRVLKCKNYQPGYCMEKTDATYTSHEFGEQRYYLYINGKGETVEGEYNATINPCRPVEVFQKCVHENCAARKIIGTVAPTAGAVTHLTLDYVATSVYKAADCEEDGYIMLNCLACLNGHEKLVGEDAVAYIDEYAETNPLLKALANETFVATGHNYDITKGTKNPAKPEVAATCVSKGQTGEIWCGNNGTCKHVIQEDKETPVRTDIDNIEVHIAGVAGDTLEERIANALAAGIIVQIGDHIDGTCTTPETDYYRCARTGCGHTVYVQGTLNQFNHVYYTVDKLVFKITATDTNTIIDHAFKAVDCGKTDGNHAYQTCKYCFNVVAVDTDDNGSLEKERDTNNNGLYNDAEPYTDKNENGKYDSGEDYTDLDEDGVYDYTDRYYTLEDTIIKKDHVFGKVDALKETCYVDGHTAYETTCTRCGAESPLTKKIIPAHGDNYATIINSEAYAPTCIKPGVAAGRYCAECDTITVDGAPLRTDMKDIGLKDPNGKIIYKIDTGKKDSDGNVIYMDWKYNSKPNLKNPTDADPWYLKPLGHYTNEKDYFSTRLAHMAEVTVQQEKDRVIVEKGTCRTETFRIIYCTYCLSSETYDVLNYDTLNDILLGRCEDPGRTVAPGAWLVYKITTGIDHKYPTPVFPEDVEKDKTLKVNVTNNFDLDGDGVVDTTFDECTVDKEWYVACEFCDKVNYDEPVKVEAAEGHYYMKDGKKTVIDISCTKFDEFKDWHCSHCDKIVGRTIVPMHNIVEVIVPAKCEYTTSNPTLMKDDMGLRFWACADCDARYFKDDSDPFATPVDPELPLKDDDNPHVEWLEPTGHEFLAFKTDKDGNLAGFKPATYTETGYVTRVCAKCGDVVSVLPKLVPTLDIEVYALYADAKKNVDEDKVVASGDEFKVLLNYKTSEVYQFNALQIDLGFDTRLAKFLTEDLDKTLPAGVAVKEENDGKLVVAIYTLDGAEVKAGETKTIELTFRARENFEKSDLIWLESAAAFNVKGAEIDNDSLMINLGAPEKVSARITGELNGFRGINAGDAIVMMDLIYAEEYISTADLDKDGDVDYNDFALLSKLIATDGTDKAYNECISENLTARTGIFYARVS